MSLINALADQRKAGSPRHFHADIRAIVMTSIMMVLLTVGLAFCAGCGLSRPYPTIRTFALEVSKTEVMASKIKRPLMIQVTSSGAAPQYETRKLVYKFKHNEFNEDFYNELVGLPSRLVADQLSFFLDANSDRFRTTQGVSSQSPDISLDVYLAAFHGDFSQQQPLSVVDVKMTLTDQRGSKPKTIWSKIYSSRLPLANTDDRPRQLTDSLGQALAQIFDKVKADLDSALGRR
jgi:ABC-type uncharacterized transport system auxiliary subunit